MTSRVFVPFNYDQGVPKSIDASSGVTVPAGKYWEVSYADSNMDIDGQKFLIFDRSVTTTSSNSVSYDIEFDDYVISELTRDNTSGSNGTVNANYFNYGWDGTDTTSNVTYQSALAASASDSNYMYRIVTQTAQKGWVQLSRSGTAGWQWTLRLRVFRRPKTVFYIKPGSIVTSGSTGVRLTYVEYNSNT